MTEHPLASAQDYETLTDADTGAKSLRIPARGFTRGNRTLTGVFPKRTEIIIRVEDVITMDFQPTAVEGITDLLIITSDQSWSSLFVNEASAARLIEFMYGISEHFYTGIRILEVPDGRNHYAFISTNRDTRIIDKNEVAGWEFKNTREDGIHNLCITLKNGHTVLIVLSVLLYQAWESAHLGRYSYRYVNYDGTVTDAPVYPPEPAPEPDSDEGSET